MNLIALTDLCVSSVYKTGRAACKGKRGSPDTETDVGIAEQGTCVECIQAHRAPKLKLW